MTARHSITMATAGALGAILISVALSAQTPQTSPSGGRGAAPAGAGPARDNPIPRRTGTASIRGRVTDAEGAPLRRAEVQVQPPTGTFEGASRLIVATDEQGNYTFTALPAARYTVTVSKSGFLSLSYGQRRPLEVARPLDVADGQVLDRIDFSLPRSAALVARVTDEFGEPVAGMRIQVHQFRFTNGERRLTAVGGSTPAASSGSDDRGEVRIPGLAPGEYYVSGASYSVVTADKGRVYAPTYYPGTTRIEDAQRVRVGIGEEVSVTFQLAAVRVSRVSGVIHSVDGTPMAAFNAVLSQPFATGPFQDVPIQPDGRFDLGSVRPGDYMLSVVPSTALPAAARPQEYALARVTVVPGQDVTGLDVTTTKGGTARGRFVFDTGPPANLRPSVLQLRINFAVSGIPATGGLTGRPVWNDDWTFEIAGLVGIDGVFRSVASGLVSDASYVPPSWYLKAIMLDGRDVTDKAFSFDAGKDLSGLQVVMTETHTELSGGARDAASRAVVDYAAVVFPEDRTQWTAVSRFIAAGRPDQRGQYKILGLPPGRYLAVALDYLPTGEERDPDLLARMADKATKLTLAEGESKSMNLPLVSY